MHENEIIVIALKNWEIASSLAESAEKTEICSNYDLECQQEKACKLTGGYLKGIHSCELKLRVLRPDERLEEGPECGQPFFLGLGLAPVDVVQHHAHQGDDEVRLVQELGSNIGLDPLEQGVGASAAREIDTR